MKKHAIITAANSTTGDFVVAHWLHSLKQNVSLETIDVVVIDYGLSASQKKALEKGGVLLFKGQRPSHIVNKRFFDARKYLRTHPHEQILFVDSGDVIFQEDISPLFSLNTQQFRVAPLGKRVLFYKWFIFKHFEEDVKREIWRVIKNKPVINAGVIFAPTAKFIALCEEMKLLIRNKEEFGPDQIIVNYHLYKENPKFLDSKYNFMMSTAYAGFRLRKGVFYKLNGEKIAIVHNAGQMNIFRPIYNFGYGEQYNQLKPVMYFLKRTMYYLLESYKRYSLKRRKR